MKLPVSVIILTYNEEENIGICLKSIADWAEEVVIVDSFSTDRTITIAKQYNAVICQHEFKSQAQQFNWSLDNLNIKGQWVIRLDADERMTDGLWEEISHRLKTVKADTNGFILNRRLHFLGRWIKHGGCYPIRLLRMFRRGTARSEDKIMDEHLVLLEGKAEKLVNDFIHENRKSIYWWTGKHNDYSSREAEEIAGTAGKLEMRPDLFGGQAASKRWVKKNLYVKSPLFGRALGYFVYRYFIRLGFLDGRPGLIFHFLQALWYRFLVDAKIYERNTAGNKPGQLS